MNGTGKDTPIPIPFTGGMNNLDTPLDLFFRKQGEVPLLVNADTSRRGRLKLLRPLMAISDSASSSIHTLFRANNTLFVGHSRNLRYLNGNTLSNLLTGLSGNDISIGHAGEWIFLGEGTNKRSVYVPGPAGCDWGQDVPDTAPTVATGLGGNPDGEYNCYYRYKITLPDGTILRTGLSPVGTVDATGGFIIEWSGIVHASFLGATSNQVELFRNVPSGSTYYLVTTLDSGTTAYSDDISDVDLQLETEFAEDGYYPPPDNINIVVYHPGCDRIFAVVDNDLYWSEPGLYHIFYYDVDADEYGNVNSVFLKGEGITGLYLLDEQLYIGSQGTWHRLRGNNPDYWTWEPTSADKGPLTWRSTAKTPWGLIYPGNDGCLWLFNGFDAQKLLESFQFDTEPTANCHGTFDGRYYYLYYGDPDYPELILDFLGYPSRPPRIIQSTRTATASHYDPNTNMFYVGDSSGYVRNGADNGESVTLTFQTAEIPAEQLARLGEQGSLLIQANTGGADLTITPYYDDEAQGALSVFSSTSLQREILSLPLNQFRSLYFLVTIITSEDIELREPWILKREEG